MILRGIPASSKSTFARELLGKESGRWVRVNRDDIRNMTHNNIFNSDNENLTRQIRDTIIITALKSDKDVIIDDCNLVPQQLKKIHRLLENVGDVKVIEKCFNISIDEAKRRNALREGRARVPDSVIDGIAHGAGIDRGRVLEPREVYYPPREQTINKYEGDESLPRGVLVDLDGTVALLNGRDPFDASNCDEDLPNIPVIECVKAMVVAGYKVIFMSGRQNKDREPTMRFISRYFPELEYELYMRATDDSRKDYLVKEELLETHVFHKYNIVFALDDRNSVVNHYRSLGLTTMQVAEGNF